MSVNRDLQDRAIRHALAIQRYGSGAADRIVRLLNSADADLVDKLAARLASIDDRGLDLGPTATKRLRALLDELKALNAAIYTKAHDALAEELSDFAEAEADFQRKALIASVGADLGMTLPAPARLRAIATEVPMEGKLLSAWTEGMEAGRIDRLSQAIRLGMVQGETTDQIVRRIRGTRAAGYADGVLDISRRSAKSITHTAVSHVSNVAAQHTWRENSHVVKGWQFLATFDSRTTITCAGLSGQVFPIGEGPIPPRHIRCRSVSVPVTRSYRELGVDADEIPPHKRANMDGQIAGDTTFSKWLGDKGAATQDEILGKTRADLWRQGKLDLAQFIKADGTILTLDQLKSSYPNLLQ
jgi:SPP1 gp7 family putative phage head morphogenesis protein